MPPESALIRRSAGRRDIEAITRTITLAFEDDPVWGPALGGSGTTIDEKAAIWRLFVTGAVRYPWSSVVDDAAAVSVWIPPEGTELDASLEEELEDVARRVLGPDLAVEYAELAERFETNHRRDTPHAYLSLLATRPDARGHGTGMALLGDDLRRLDELHLPAWLESTNPANDRRYRSVGFEPVGEFQTIDEQRVITTMWRAAR